MAGSLNMVTRDAGMVNEIMRRRPARFRKLTVEFKDEVTDATLEAVRVARAQLTDPESSLEAGKLVATLMSVVERMDADNMKEEHHEIDCARGAGEHKVENKIIVIPSPVVKDMAEMRKLAEKREEG